MNLQYIGELNVELIGEYKDKIITNELILTDERLYEHILIYHEEDYKMFNKYILEVIQFPDYVIEDNKHLNTLIYLKEIKRLGQRCRIVVKLALGIEEEHPKNSIITLMKQNERTWNQTLKNRGRILFRKN